MRVGVLSDTHNLLRPQALAALRGCDHLLHAGDIGESSILGELRGLAPFTAVRGNNDEASAWARTLPERCTIVLGGVRVHLLHDLATLPPDVAADVIVCGHSHRPKIEQRGAQLILNPGSCGPRRFRLPVGVAELMIEDGVARARLIELAV